LGFRFRDDESPGDGLRRVAVEALADAAALLRAPPDGDADVAVHEARKATKKTRAALRLGRELLPGKRRRALDRALREAARDLAPARDAAVRLRTAREAARAADLDPPDAVFEAWLAGTAGSAARDAGGGPSRAGGGAVRGEAGDGTSGPTGDPTEAAPRGAAPRSLARHADAFDRLRFELDGAAWRDGGAKRLRKGLERLHARGRRAFGRVGDPPDAGRLHACRTHTKRLGYALRLLQPTWPPLVAAEAREVRRLAELLGRDHDLALLHVALRRDDRPTGAPPDVAALAAWLDAEIARGRAEALPLLRRLYAEPSEAFAARHAGWWSAWRAEADRR
jgi:CHAD domain-containing protein